MGQGHQGVEHQVRIADGVAPHTVHSGKRRTESRIVKVVPLVVTVPYEEDIAGMIEDVMAAKKAATFEKRYGVVLDPDYPHLSYGADAKRSLIAKAVLACDGVRRVSFLPVLIDKRLRPEVLRHSDPRFDDAVCFMEWVSEDFDLRLTVDGDEVLVTGSDGA
mgnify:CR=1 FL=1